MDVLVMLLTTVLIALTNMAICVGALRSFLLFYRNKETKP